ncbi:hypothetical protein [Corynebacterium sp. HMSC055D05]|uniref:hypothetical protein n=1 Tax=Corynebacterium sp. HMSC055D05 TaxID=1715213 RepID=UPI0008A1E524|nr:hypothetical protein [Corynebacterium sp. HMSC055D05]OFL93646.1 hypothetical protein HMPREF2734_00325 [Corynebacterium sp. HMSC055D05]
MARTTHFAAWSAVTALVAGTATAATLLAPAQGEIPTGDDVITVDVDIERMRFIPDRVEVPRGTKLVVNLTNSGEKEHDLKVGEGYSGRLSPGESATSYYGEFNVDTLGWCTIAGHKTMGMLFRVDVTP